MKNTGLKKNGSPQDSVMHANINHTELDEYTGGNIAQGTNE